MFCFVLFFPCLLEAFVIFLTSTEACDPQAGCCMAPVGAAAFCPLPHCPGADWHPSVGGACCRPWEKGAPLLPRGAPEKAGREEPPSPSCRVFLPSGRANLSPPILPAPPRPTRLLPTHRSLGRGSAGGSSFLVPPHLSTWTFFLTLLTQQNLILSVLPSVLLLQGSLPSSPWA